MVMFFLLPRIPFTHTPLEDISVETVIVVGVIALLILCPCLWLIKYLKDDGLNEKYQESLIITHIVLTLVLTIATGAFLRSFELINSWVEQQPLIVLVYVVLALSAFGVGVGKLTDCWVYHFKEILKN